MHVIFSIARVLLVLIFILSGGMQVLDPQTTADQLAKIVAIPDVLLGAVTQAETTTGMKWPTLLAMVLGTIEVVAGLLLAFNIATRGAALVLVIFVLVTTYYAFGSTGGDQVANLTQVLKNLSIVGGLLTYVVLGSWRPVPANQI